MNENIPSTLTLGSNENMESMILGEQFSHNFISNDERNYLLNVTQVKYGDQILSSLNSIPMIISSSTNVLMKIGRHHTDIYYSWKAQMQ